MLDRFRRIGEKNKALRKFIEARKLRDRRKSEEKKRRELQAVADRTKEEDRQKVEEEKRRLERIVKHERAVMLFSDVVNELVRAPSTLCCLWRKLMCILLAAAVAASSQLCDETSRLIPRHARHAYMHTPVYAVYPQSILGSPAGRASAPGDPVTSGSRRTAMRRDRPRRA